MKLQRKKIGNGYYQSGYGKGFIKGPIVYVIDGKCFARHLRGWDVAFNQSLEGYVRVNAYDDGDDLVFIQCSDTTTESHRLFKPKKELKAHTAK